MEIIVGNNEDLDAVKQYSGQSSSSSPIGGWQRVREKLVKISRFMPGLPSQSQRRLSDWARKLLSGILPSTNELVDMLKKPIKLEKLTHDDARDYHERLIKALEDQKRALSSMNTLFNWKMKGVAAETGDKIKVVG